LHTEVTVTRHSISCKTPDYAGFKMIQLENEDCLKFLVLGSRKAGRLFFKSSQELETYLHAEFEGTSVQVAANSSHVVMVKSSKGYYACAGVDERIPDLEEKEKQSLYSFFYSKLFHSLAASLAILDDGLGLMVDTIHGLSLEVEMPLVNFSNESVLTQITRLQLEFMPTPAKSVPAYPSFDQFFLSELASSSDEEIHGLLKDFSLIKTMPATQQTKLLSALKSFGYSLQHRFGSFLGSLGFATSLVIPNTVLLKKEQDSQTFVLWVHQMAPGLEERGILEAFIILQNLKYMLASDLSIILFADFGPKVPPSLSSYLRLGDMAQSKVPGSDSGYSGSRRQKRSWSGFWSSLFGTATAEEVQKIYDSEYLLSKEEQETRQSLNDLTGANKKMVSTMKSVFHSVTTLQDKQTALFKDIKDLVDSEYALVGNVKNTGRKLEAATRLINEYQAVASGSVLIFQTAEKMHRLIEAALTNVLDVGQVSLPSLRRFLTRNFRLSLTQVETQFRFSPVGYEAVFKIPRYGESFTVYWLKQLPSYISGNWFKIPNLSDKVIMNSEGRIILPEEAKRACQIEKKDVLCNQGAVSVRQPLPSNCAANLVLALHSRQAELSSCVPKRIAYTMNQDFMIKDESLIIANPAAEDKLEIVCRTSKTDSSLTLPKGLSSVPYHKNCEYSTQEMTISGVQSELLGKVPILSSDLDQLNSLNLAGNSMLALDSLGSASFNLSSLLTSLDVELEAQGKAVSELKAAQDQLDLTKQLTEIDPFKIDFDRPTSASNAVVVLLWSVLALLGITALASCFLCPECLGQCMSQTLLATGKFLKGCLMPVLAFVAKCCTTRRPQGRSQQDSEVEMSESVTFIKDHAIIRTQPLCSASAPGMYPTLGHDSEKAAFWTIKEGLYSNLLLSGVMTGPGGQQKRFLYDPKSGKLTDSTGHKVTGIALPPGSLILEFQNKVEALPLPDFMKTEEGVVLAKFPHIKLVDQTWMDLTSGQTVPGLRVPQNP